MKKAATFFAAALMVGLLALPAHAASFYPVAVEEYTYGPLDEQRIDKVYQLSRNDDPKDRRQGGPGAVPPGVRQLHQRQHDYRPVRLFL